MAPVKPAPGISYEQHVAARLVDFFSPTTVWQRRLWAIGPVLALRELVEAAGAVREGVLFEATFGSLWSETLALVGHDPACEPWSPTLRAQTPPDRVRVTEESFRFEIIRLITDEVSTEYLERWARLLDPSNTGRPRPERAARAIASHLLDCGLHPLHLVTWWEAALHKAAGPSRLPDLVRDAANLLRIPERRFTVTVPLLKRFPASLGQPENWKGTRWVKVRLDGHETARGLRQQGGLVFEPRARDPWSAVDSVFESLEQLRARLEIGARVELAHASFAHVDGESSVYPLVRSRRGVEVGALERNRTIFDGSGVTRLDSALALAAPLDVGAPGPAVAGGWSAVEALLSGPGDGDRGSAADRLASLVACSFPRAELTTLSYAVSPTGPGQSLLDMMNGKSNHERSKLTAAAIGSASPIEYRRLSDVAAAKRVSDMVAQPKKKLLEVEGYARTAIRRLYRNRNLVLHWGRLDAVGLRACLRTAAPMIGAGIDRIAHAQLVHEMPPLELAARARLRLDLLDSNPIALTDLLE